MDRSNAHFSNELERLILILFSGTESSLSVNDANDKILKLIETQESWTMAVELLNSSIDFVQFFAANILYTKLRKQWTSLVQLQREQIFGIYHEKLQSLSLQASIMLSKAFVTRVIVSFICICTYIPDGLVFCTNMALNMIGTGHPNSQLSSQALYIGLQLLAALPVELSELDVSRGARQSHLSHLQQTFQSLLHALDDLARRWTNSIGCGTTIDPGLNNCISSCLKTLRAWSATGLTPTTLSSTYPALLTLLSYAIGSGHKELVVEACGLVEDLVGIGEHPRPASRDVAVTSLASLFITHAAALTDFFQPDGEEDCATAVCNALCTLLSLEIKLFTSRTGFSVDLFALVLSCTAHSNRQLATITFDVWISLPDVSEADRHPAIRESVLEQLLVVLVRQSLLPTDKAYSEEDESVRGMLEFRDDRRGYKEAVLCCLDLQGSRFVDILGDLINSTLSSGMNGSSCATIEAVLNLTCSAVEAMLSDDVEDLALQQSYTQYLCNCLSMVLSSPFAQQQQQYSNNSFLLSTTVKLIGNSTRILVTDTSKLHDAVGYLQSCLLNPQYASDNSLLQTTSSALKGLCVRNAALLASTSIEPGSSMSGSKGGSTLSQSVSRIVGSIQSSRSEQGLSAPRPGLVIAVEVVAQTCRQLDEPQFHSARNEVYAIGFAVLEMLSRGEMAFAASPQSTSSLISVIECLKCLAVLVKQSVPSSTEQVVRAFIRETVAKAQSFDSWSKSAILAYQATGQPLGPIQSVTKEIFNIYEETVLNNLSIGKEFLPSFCESALNTASVCSLRCLCTVVESLSVASTSQWPSEERSGASALLCHLLVSLTQLAMQWLDNAVKVEDGCYDKYLKIITRYQRQHLDLFLSSPCLAMIPQLCLRLLETADFNVVRVSLEVMQGYFLPAADTSDAHKLGLLRYGCAVGDRYLSIVLGSITGRLQVQSTLQSYYSDALYCIILGCSEEPQSRQMLEEWTKTILFDTSVCPSLSQPVRETIYFALFRLASQDRRRFKVLVQDLCKVGLSEMDSDVLLSYAA